MELGVKEEDELKRAGTEWKSLKYFIIRKEERKEGEGREGGRKLVLCPCQRSAN